MSRDIGVDFKKIFKKREMDPDYDILPETSALMKSRLPVPPELAEDLAEYVTEIEEHGRMLDLAVDLCDLFTDNLDPKNTVMIREDWVFIRDLTNSWAEDMDLDIVTRVMQLILDAGAFD